MLFVTRIKENEVNTIFDAVLLKMVHFDDQLHFCIPVSNSLAKESQAEPTNIDLITFHSHFVVLPYHPSYFYIFFISTEHNALLQPSVKLSVCMTSLSRLGLKLYKALNEEESTVTFMRCKRFQP